MENPEFLAQLRRSWSLFRDRLRISRAIVCAQSLPVDEQFRDVALEPSSSYADIYRMGLSRSNYNFILVDYSYFQFSWETTESWRLAYLPNPWIAGVAGAQNIVTEWEALEEMGDLTHEETSDLIAEMAYMGSIPPIRFEYSRSQYKEMSHPAAHFHVGRHTDNRWPSSVLIGPHAFSMFVARLYYADEWRKLSSFEQGQADQCIELEFMRTLDATQVSHDFSVRERSSFHLGRHMVVESELAEKGRPRGRGSKK